MLRNPITHEVRADESGSAGNEHPHGDIVDTIGPAYDLEERLRVLVTGAGGQLGAELAPRLAGHDAVLLDHETLDVTDPIAVEGVLDSAGPDVIIHAAAWTDVDGCEGDPERARSVNVVGTRNVAASAGNAFVIVVSTDYVFDGTAGRAYREIDETNPLQVYGRTKLEAEEAARAETSSLAIARTAWLYGARTATGEPARNFASSILRAAARGPLDVVDDQVGSPTWTGDLADALMVLAERRTAGTFHVANGGAVSRYDFARAILEDAGGDPSVVRAVSTKEAAARPAARPMYAPLDGVAWRAAGFDALPDWRDALARAMPGINAAV
ncbi:MAG TPA: dTDP-4-dehydrorhamnose reductase [Actinomycetota bacterium]|nr:dTDP-4-dehydrorhamnose reductase [Actinomycetota bacterium]